MLRRLVRAVLMPRHDDAFAATVREIRSGRVRADRMTFVVGGGDNEVPDRMKLLLAILYAAHVHGSLLPVRISPATQASIIDAWTALTADSPELYLQLARTGEILETYQMRATVAEV